MIETNGPDWVDFAIFLYLVASVTFSLWMADGIANHSPSAKDKHDTQKPQDQQT